MNGAGKTLASARINGLWLCCRMCVRFFLRGTPHSCYSLPAIFGRDFMPSQLIKGINWCMARSVYAQYHFICMFSQLSPNFRSIVWAELEVGCGDFKHVVIWEGKCVRRWTLTNVYLCTYFKQSSRRFLLRCRQSDENPILNRNVSCVFTSDITFILSWPH